MKEDDDMGQQVYDAKEVSVIERENLGGMRHRRSKKPPLPKPEAAERVASAGMKSAHRKGSRRRPGPPTKGRFAKR